MLSLKRPYYPITTITLIQQTCVVQSIKSVGQRKVVHRILILGQHQSRCIVLQAVDKIGKCCPRIGKTKKNVKVWTSRTSGCQVSAIYQFYCYRTWVRSLHWLPLSVTHWLTDCCLVDLIDLTLACEDGNSKLVEVVTVADVVEVVEFLFRLWAHGLVKILKGSPIHKGNRLMLGWGYEI